MESLRASPLLVRSDAVTNLGGLSFANPNPCDGTAVLAAPVDVQRAFLELRYRPAVASAPGVLRR